MELLLDENNNVVLKDGMPVYRYNDGSEQPFDAKATLESLNGKVKDLEEREKRHAENNEKISQELGKYKDIDLEEVKKNAEIIKKLEDKDLVDEKGVEALKKTMIANFEEEKKADQRKNKKVLKQLEEENGSLQKMIFNMAVINKFSNDDHFSGKEPKTFYPPEDAAKVFGDNFKVEIKNDKVRVHAVDKEGNVVMSKKNHGEIADFHEAIEILIDQHPRRDDILRSGKKGGPGATGNIQIGSKEFNKLSSQDMIKEGLSKRRATI